VSETPNPWLRLPLEPPFVLPGDQPAIETFNRSAAHDYRVETGLMPEPFVGRPNAPILLLLLNPGVSDDDFALHEQAFFRERIRVCHRWHPATYANYFLDPDVSGPGARWMSRVLGSLIREFGTQTVATCVASLEYFPYHSRRFAHHRLRVTSQQYGFELLRSAIHRGAAIFVTRGARIWENAVPELHGYQRAFRTRSVQNVVISPRNCPEGYEAARLALRGL
jgi:hypothetical protein